MNLAIFLCLTAIIAGSTAVRYDCNFSNRKVWFADATFYDCDVASGTIMVKQQACVLSVSGSHLSGNNDAKVKSIGISKPKTQYMPRGLAHYFPDLVSIDIYKVGLLEVHQDDLKLHKNLKFLSLAENKLRHLEENLFALNPKLEVILLHKNQIKTVAPAFKDLKNLRHIIFEGNKCYSGTEANKHQISSFIRTIYERCPFRQEHALEQCLAELSAYKNQCDNTCEQELEIPDYQ